MADRSSRPNSYPSRPDSAIEIEIEKLRRERQSGSTIAYRASKADVVGMTLPMARGLSRLGARVMTMAHGLFLTAMMEGLPRQVQLSDAPSTKQL